MTRSYHENQLQKIDGPHIQPIYFIHFSVTWQKKYVSIVDDWSVCSSDGTKKIEGLKGGAYHLWADGTVLPGDSFQMQDYASSEWKEIKTIDYVDDNDTLHVTENYPAYQGCGYRIYGTFDLRLSDRNFKYNGIDYECYLKSLSNIENQIRNLGGMDNRPITLEFLNSRISIKNYLIELLDDAKVEGTEISIYKLLIDTGESFGSDVSTLIFKGIAGQPDDIGEAAFKIDLHSRLYSKEDSLPIDVIKVTDFAGAHKNDIGKHRNILYGDLDKVICLWTNSGWETTLAEAINAGTTSVTLSEAHSPTFTAICDEEEIRFTSGSNPYSVTRGYNGTTARAHGAGTLIYYKTDWEAEVAQHPVKSIGNVYGKRGSGEWFRITSGYTAYEDAGGRAYIAFTNRPKYGSVGDLDVALAEDPHAHVIQGMTVVSKLCVPTGYLTNGADNPENVIDGNTASYAGIAEDESVGASFTEANLGTISKEIIHIYKNSENASGYVQCPSGTNLTTLGAGIGWFRIVKISGMAWGDSIVVVGGSGGNQIGEIYKDIEYTPAPETQDTELSPYLTGDAVSNIVVADTVACDVEGYQDDGSGTYTGTPDALIERPDHVRKHILIALLGFSADDIDASFGTVGTTYAGRISGGYKFAFNLPEVALKTMELFRQFDLQTRSNMFESQGKFKLAFGSTSTPTSQMTFANTTNPEYKKTKSDFIFSKTDYADIRNTFRGFYYRNYAKSGNLGDKYQGLRETTDSDSITRYGERILEIEFSCVGDLYTMIDDVLTWIKHELKDVRRKVAFCAFWDASILDNCDYFTVISNFWSGEKFRTTLFIESDDRKTIKIEGEQYVT